MLGLKGAWGNDFSEVKARLARQKARIEATKMVVLSWGPGESHPNYPKREQIGEAVGALPGVEVVTPEAIARYSAPVIGVPTMTVEEIELDDADLAVCLAVDNPTATGIQFEVSSVREKTWMRDRIRLLAPKDPRHHKGLLGEAVRLFPPDQTLRYDTDQYTRCDDMRAAAVAWVQAAQVRKYWRSRQVEELNRENNA